MKTEHLESLTGKPYSKFTLEASDFAYLSKEFKIVDGSIGIDFESIKNPKLSIHIGKYGIKYDKDISHLKLFMAKERIDVSINLLDSSGDTPPNFKQFIPNTSDQLEYLITKFKYRGMGNVTKEDIITFLQKDLVDSK